MLNQKKENKKEEITYDQLVLACMKMGLSMRDIDNLEIGMLIDLLITFLNQLEENDKQSTNIRNATQEDFDRF